MKHLLVIGLALGCFGLSATSKDGPLQSYPDSLELYASNPLRVTRVDEAVLIPVASILEKNAAFDPRTCTVYSGGAELPSQIDDSNRDGSPDLLTVVADFAPNERKSIVLRWGPNMPPKKEYAKRTQADISMKVDYEFVDGKYEKGRYVRIDSVRVPAVHVDHDALFQHEGPAWESDRVGYRFYLDARNRTDIYGKKIADMVLHTAGVHDLVADHNESYESMLYWGMDNFKVGTSLGIGSVAMLNGATVETVSDVDSEFCVIAANGPVRADVRATYYGWKVAGLKFNLISSYSITAGSRLTLCRETISPNPANLCTGIAKHENTTLLEPADQSGSGWKYLGLYGKQSRAGDDMGIAIFYKGSEKIDRRDDDVSYLVTLKPHQGELKYYFAAAWQQELHGITTLEDFRSYLEEVTKRLDNPITVLF